MVAERFEGTAVLVTGGAGFIGSHLVDELVRRRARVRVLDDYSTGSARNLEQHAAGIERIEGDIRDDATCRRAISGVEVVFHQAALGSVPRSIADPVTTYRVNVLGTVNIFRAAAEEGVRRVVYASSSSVYGDSAELPKREGREGSPLSPYAASKRATEDAAAAFHNSVGLEAVGLRYSNVYGPRQSPEGPYAAAIPRFFAACLSGRPPTIFGDGEQSRDFTFVADVVAANLLASGVDASACGRAYNVACGRATTINDLAGRIAGLTGFDGRATHAAARPGDVRHSHLDTTLAREELGFISRIDVETGLARTRDHYAALESGRTDS